MGLGPVRRGKVGISPPPSKPPTIGKHFWVVNKQAATRQARVHEGTLNVLKTNPWTTITKLQIWLFKSAVPRAAIARGFLFFSAGLIRFSTFGKNFIPPKPVAGGLLEQIHRAPELLKLKRAPADVG